jgi:hypothetical protein
MGSDGNTDKGKGKGPTLGGFAAYIPPAGGKPSGRDYVTGTFQSDYQPKGKGAKTGMPGSDFTNTDRRWVKSERAREEAKTAKRDDLPPDDRTKGCLRDETGARRFRDKLHQQCFTEACEFLGFDVDELHVMPEEDVELAEEQAEIIRRVHEARRRKQEKREEKPQRFIGIYKGDDDRWRPLDPDTPEFQEIILKASKQEVDVSMDSRQIQILRINSSATGLLSHRPPGADHLALARGL